MRGTKLLTEMVFLATVVFFAGCARLQETYKAVTAPRPVIHQPDYDEKKFTSPDPQGPTAVQSAVELSEKYVQLSEELAAERQKRQALDAENPELKGQVARLKAQLAQAEKELSDANRLLLDMRIELGKWKHDVLGFRDEMREARKAELQGLAQILKVLGAEEVAELARQDFAQAGSSSGQGGEAQGEADE